MTFSLDDDDDDVFDDEDVDADKDSDEDDPDAEDDEDDEEEEETWQVISALTSQGGSTYTGAVLDHSRQQVLKRVHFAAG